MKESGRGAPRAAGRLLAALVMAAAPWLDVAVVRKLRPDATDAFGYLYQLVGRVFAALRVDRLAAAMLLAVCLWLCTRYLFRKPKGTGLGEYLLCGFLSVMMLLCTAVRTQDTVAVLWANAFQLATAGLYALGMFFTFLTLLRGLRELLTCRRKPALPPWARAWNARHPMLVPCAVIALAWLPQIILRYPGVLMWDSYMQIKQFMGEAERWANHPPFGTLFYGALAWLGGAVGSRNAVYFAFTLAQCACYVAVLGYSLCVMRRLGVPAWARGLALALYALSPCYAGWATVIAKDSMFQIPFLLMVTLVLECVCDRDAFFASCRRVILLGVCFTVMALSRHNGAPLACGMTGALALWLLLKRAGWRKLLCLLACCVLSVGVAEGGEAAISAALGIRERYIPDVLSLPFQQTARVVKLHGAEIPAGERAVLDSVLDYDHLAENYDDWYADAVKDTYRPTAGARERAAYWRVWWAQLKRWPAEYLDAALHMNGVLFDLRDNEPMYICFSDMALDEYVYPWSFNDMTMYESEALRGLNSAQRALTEWYMDFDKLPLVGLFATMSFHVVLMLMMLYIDMTQGRRSALLVWLPSLVTFAICLFSPVVYLRYALPLVGAMPICLAAHFAIRGKEEPQ